MQSPPASGGSTPERSCQWSSVTFSKDAFFLDIFPDSGYNRSQFKNSKRVERDEYPAERDRERRPLTASLLHRNPAKTPRERSLER